MPTLFEELPHSPRLNVDDGQITARRIFLVAWPDWPAFVGELYGAYQVIDGASVYTPPAHFPGQPDLIVHKLTVEPFPGDRASVTTAADLLTGTNQYLYAQVTADYSYVIDNNRPGYIARARLPAVPNGTYLEIESNLAAEFQTSPARYWRYRADPTTRVADDAHIGILRPCEDLVIRWRRVPLPPFETIRAKRGCVNVGDFLGLTGGTALFLGAKVRRDFQIIDTGLWRLDYHFKVREPGWNFALNPNGGWSLVENDDGALPYNEADFDTLFAFA